MKYIKDCLPCCFLNLHYLNQKKQKHLLIHKHRFSSYALITIIITIMANTILNSLSRNNLCFIIFSSIISICLSIAIIVSFSNTFDMLLISPMTIRRAQKKENQTPGITTLHLPLDVHITNCCVSINRG